jgi:hypothetical protein
MRGSAERTLAGTCGAASARESLASAWHTRAAGGQRDG